MVTVALIGNVGLRVLAGRPPRVEEAAS